MKTKLKKIASNEQEEDIISVVVADITNYVNQEEKEYVTTQHLVGMELIFKG